MSEPEDLNNTPEPPPPPPSGSESQPPIVSGGGDQGAALAPLHYAPQEPSRFERWMANNVAPMLVTGVSLFFGFVASVAAPHVMHLRTETPTPPPVPKLPVHDLPDEYRLLRVGVGIFFAVLILIAAIPDARRWLTRFVKRALPALRGFDLIAIIAVFFAADTVMAVAAYGLRPYFNVDQGIKTAARLIINDAAFLSGLICAICLARIRAHGKHGSMGLWPFWTLVGKVRPLWKDMALGLVCYPCVAITIATMIYPISHITLKALGKPVDHNPVINEIMPIHGGWALAVMVITVSIGAAVFEELLFRGILYNVMRRYFGAVGGAIISSAIFAGLHRTWTEGPALFFLALVLIWLYERTGRLVASMTLHAVNNGVALMALMAYQSYAAGNH